MEKNYIIKYASELPKKDRQLLLSFIKQRTNKISECGDGCRINLDRLPDDTIHNLYLLVKNRIDFYNLINF